MSGLWGNARRPAQKDAGMARGCPVMSSTAGEIPGSNVSAFSAMAVANGHDGKTARRQDVRPLLLYLESQGPDLHVTNLMMGRARCCRLK